MVIYDYTKIYASYTFKRILGTYPARPFKPNFSRCQPDMEPSCKSHGEIFWLVTLPPPKGIPPEKRPATKPLFLAGVRNGEVPG